jgi:hypothetical protein
MPQASIIDFLKILPQLKILEIFDALMVSYDDAPLTKSERQKINKSIKENNKGELVDWKAISKI